MISGTLDNNFSFEMLPLTLKPVQTSYYSMLMRSNNLKLQQPTVTLYHSNMHANTSNGKPV